MLRERKKITPKKAVSLTIVYFFMVLFAIVLLFPYVFMISKSLMTGTEAAQIPVELFPKKPTASAYGKIFSSENSYMLYAFNSFKIILFNVIAIPLSASLVAYGFSKTKFFGKNALFAVMLSTMMLPTMVLQIPQFVMFMSFGWYDSMWPLTIPNLFGGGAANIFLIRQFMRGIPNSLDEAAKIDGANAFIRYLAITLPLCKAIIIFMMVSTFIAYWSDFYGPLIYLKSPSKFTLAIGIFKESEQLVQLDDKPVLMASGVFMTIFPAILFGFFQKELIEGVQMTGLKG